MVECCCYDDYLLLERVYTAGADPRFSERGVRKFKERGLECSPRSYRVYIVNTKIIHLHEHMFKQLSNQLQVSVASYMILSK